MADDKKEKTGAAAPKVILGLPLLQFIFVVVNLLLMVGGLFFIYSTANYRKPPITEPQAELEMKNKITKKSTDENAGFFVESYPEMHINLRSQQGGKPHFAAVEVSIVCPNQGCLDLVKANRAKLEDLVQTVISSRSYSEINSLDVKFRIKHELVNKANALVQDAGITEVLFSNFVAN